MRTSLSDYQQRYRHVRMQREDGILELRLHTEGGPLVWGDGPHSELGFCFGDVAADPDNRVVIITGSQDRFIADMDQSWVGAMTPEKWLRIYTHGRRLLTALLEIPVPVIGAVNGAARVHAELAVLSDAVLAADHAYFQDAPHFRHGTVPGDGVQLVWQLLLGPNRGRYFLLTGQRLSAEEALRLGVVNEVVPAEELSARAWELAGELARQSDITLRYTRAALVGRLRQLVAEEVTHGLALEGLGAHAVWPTGD